MGTSRYFTPPHSNEFSPSLILASASDGVCDDLLRGDQYQLDW